MNNLSKRVVKLLRKKKLNISFAESCTGGLLSSSITSVDGASKVFTLALIVYSKNSKIKILKIPNNLLTKYGAVSEQICLLMVKNLNKISKTHLSFAITGIAGPSGATKKKPVGLVYLAIKKGNKIKVKKHLFKNEGRAYIQKAAVNKSLRLILNFVK